MNFTAVLSCLAAPVNVCQSSKFKISNESKVSLYQSLSFQRLSFHWGAATNINIFFSNITMLTRKKANDTLQCLS